MILTSGLALIALHQEGLKQAVDPLLLFPESGTVKVSQGLIDSTTGKAATPEDVIAAAKGVRFLLVGESHTSPEHHKLQAALIEAAAKSGRPVVVGLEMFTRDNQANIAPWSSGTMSEEDFIVQSNWKTQWGFDFAFYRPIFDAIKRHKLPLYALNAPRDWVRQVGRNGPGILTEEQKKWVPEVYMGNERHRALFKALIGGHPLEGQRGENMIAAQIVWDTAMAQTALEASQTHQEALVVILAGSGHVMYQAGINYRLQRLAKAESLDVVCIDIAEEREVSKSIGRFIFASPPPIPKERD
ncbi:MAG: ChaN family lipoprotein [Fimbriimonadaceae bacterium]|jgi:uncharacterized iron-regulated protein|nr:ChaN family lipoprotein [Fimbriimonadaceae bacterium]